MIAIIDYKAGNLMSVKNALNRLGCDSIVTDKPEEISGADKVILPGVGEASTAMRQLSEKRLESLIITLKQPVLGICLGMQLMCRSSEEGATEGMGIFDTTVRKFPLRDKIPHMGWNNLYETKGLMMKGLKGNEDVYFVHSYYAELCDSTSAITEYIIPFSAALQKNNFYATQFHPEKSGATGILILKNFIEL